MRLLCYLKDFLNFIETEDGATAVEYALMLALITAVIVGAVALLGGSVNSVFNDPELRDSLTVD